MMKLSRKLFACGLYLTLIPLAHASEVADSDSSAPAASAPESFGAEYRCGRGLKTRFANHEGTLGGCVNDNLSSQTLILPAKRSGRLGFYTLNQDQVPKFFELKPELKVNPNDDLAAYFLRFPDPATQKDLVLDYTSVDMEDETYREAAIIQPLTPQDLRMFGSNRVKSISSVPAADAETRATMQQCLKGSIEDVPEFMHVMDSLQQNPAAYHVTDADLIQNLKAIVCNCRDVKGLETTVQKLIDDQAVKPYKKNLNCDLISSAY